MGRIPTTDAAGNPNGAVITVWSALENPGLRPEQVYVTIVAPHSVKGPHLHKKRRGLFCCIKGNVRIVSRRPTTVQLIEVSRSGALGGEGSTYREYLPGLPEYHYLDISTGEANGHRLVLIPPGVACAIYNDGDEDAYVINLPSPAWSAEDPDEHEVKDWDYKWEK